ncbi:MAG: hypothetical protein HQ501_14535, partial [Rhodospirillales bacterium]|nr:hypothetical protein [Rhodospirillales bacterium]
MVNVSKKPSIDSTQIERETGVLFGRCLESFYVFADLPQLSEDMRVLSLNAELAAGRAGDKGTGVRALTQYTRALVNRLNNATENMAKLKGRMYTHSASAIRVFQRSALFERADHTLRVSGSEAVGIQAAHDKINAARNGCLMTALEQVRY